MLRLPVPIRDCHPIIVEPLKGQGRCEGWRTVMSSTAAKTDPVLWEKVKSEVTGEGKGGKPGQWSARKAQLATLIYKREGGGYEGQKSQDNHLTEWTHEEWGTKSGAESGRTGERYLPKQARKSLS